MPFANEDEIIAAPKLEWPIHKISASFSGGVQASLWTNVGTPAAGSDPAAGSATLDLGGTAHDNEPGSIYFDDTNSDEKYLTGLTLVTTQAGVVILWDRLCSVSGITTHTSTGLRNVNSVPLPRYTGTDAREVACFLELTQATNTTAPVANLRYTNEAGTSGRQGGNVTFPAAATPQRAVIRMPLQGSDRGVRSVQSVEIVTASNTTGVANVVLAKQLAVLPQLANTGNERNFVHRLPSLQRIYDGASLMITWQPLGTTAITVEGMLYLAVKEN